MKILQSLIVIAMLIFSGCPEEPPKDNCPLDPSKTEPSICGCGVADVDSNSDGIFECQIAVVTQYTENLLIAYADLTTKNHQEYTNRYQYTYVKREGRISGDNFQDPAGKDPIRKDGLYWQKVTAISDALAELRPGSTREPRYVWVMWVDADVVFSNPNIRLEQIMEKYGTGKDLLLPKDATNAVIAINNGVFLLHNTQWSRDYMKQVASLYPRYKNDLTPEQDAMRDLSYSGPDGNQFAYHGGKYTDDVLQTPVRVIPQRVMDSFQRQKLGEPTDAQWVPCDFIAHVSGLPDLQRRVVIEDILKQDSSSCPATVL